MDTSVRRSAGPELLQSEIRLYFEKSAAAVVQRPYEIGAPRQLGGGPEHVYVAKRIPRATHIFRCSGQTVITVMIVT